MVEFALPRIGQSLNDSAIEDYRMVRERKAWLEEIYSEHETYGV